MENGLIMVLNAIRSVIHSDLIMFGTGAAITLLLLVLVDSNDTIMILLSCLPVGITGLLVVPIPNYHNVLCAIQSIFKFYTERRNYIWRGWCFYEKFGSDDKK